MDLFSSMLELDTAPNGLLTLVNRTRSVYPFPTLSMDVGSDYVNDAVNYLQGRTLYTKRSRCWAGLVH